MLRFIKISKPLWKCFIHVCECLICLHLEELQRQMYTSIEDGIVFRSCDNIMQIIGTPQVI